MSWLSDATGIDINLGPKKQKGPEQLDPSEITKFLSTGLDLGQRLTGTDIAGVGEGAKTAREGFMKRLKGESAGASALRQDQNEAIRQRRAQQMVQGVGQMSASQDLAQQRMQQRDMARFKSQEERQNLMDVSREYGKAGGNILKAGGQVASVLTGAQPAPVIQPQGGGLLSGIFGGLF